RLALHRIEANRVRLIQLSDQDETIPLTSASVDHVNCIGVLHHTSRPDLILAEFYRVLKSGGTGCIMVYNYESVWLHLYTAYERMILEGAFQGLSIRAAFAKNVDGEGCPI